MIRSRAWIENQISEGATLTLLGVPRGSGVRMGIDRNLDGVLDGEHPPMILSIRHLNGGEEIELSWLLEAHRPHRVEYSETLAPGSWIPITGDIVGQDGVATFSDSPAAAGPSPLLPNPPRVKAGWRSAISTPPWTGFKLQTMAQAAW